MKKNVLSALFCIIAFITASNAAAQPPAALVKVDPVSKEPLVQTVPILGHLVAKQFGEVAAKINGPIQTFLVDVGDRLAKNQLIAELDATDLIAEKEIAAAHLEEQTAKLKTQRETVILAQQERQRFERLQDASSKSHFEDARQKEAIAKAKVLEVNAAIQSARASLKLAEQRLSYAQITAPFAGVITERLSDTGTYVQRGQHIVKLLADRDLEIEAEVPSQRLAGLKPGISVQISLDDSSQHLAVVRAIIPKENQLTRTRRVRFVPEFTATEQALADGQSVTVHVPSGPPRDVLSVHKDAINKKDGQDSVYVVEDGIAKLRPVILGDAVGNRFEVLEGLQTGDQVVVRGNERLQPESKVRLSDEAPPKDTP